MFYDMDITMNKTNSTVLVAAVAGIMIAAALVATLSISNAYAQPRDITRGGNGGQGGAGGAGGNGGDGGVNVVRGGGNNNGFGQHANGGDANGGHGGNANGGDACHNRCRA
jgi:hypothetical protein